MRRILSLLMLSTLVLAGLAEAGTITRPGKSFGGTSFITGVVPTAADFNGDIDTAYSEINGSITNVNISASAAIAGSKISPAFTLDTSITTANPCLIWVESDQAADAQRWYACVSSGVWQLHTRTDAGVVQATPIQINRSTGAVTFVAATFATQVQMEAATSLVLPVTPASTQYHPGVAKAWAAVENTGGTPSTKVAYNVASYTDNGVGDITVNFTTAFSTSNAACVPTVATDVVGFALITSTATGSVRVETRLRSDGTNVDTDFMVICFGDQ